MKKLFFFSFIMGYLTFSFAQSDPSIQWLHPKPNGNWLKWIKMINENVWYIGGEYGAFLKTTDGGQNFTVNNKGGWANRTYPGQLINWHSNNVWWSDQDNAILVGSNAAGILKTTNGGVSFDTITVLPTGTATANGIHFVNQSLGFVCGNTAWGLWKTTDGGSTWSQLTGLTSGNYYDVYASDASNILAFSDQSRVYKSTDGGASWAMTQFPGINSNLWDAEFVNSDTGYVIGSSGLFKYTTNGGASWQGNNPTDRTLYTLEVNGTDVIVGGFPSDSLYRSNNFGTTWQPINCVGSGDYFLWYTDGIDKIGSTIVTVGAYGTILKSIDDGHTWVSLSHKVSDASFTYTLYVNPASKKIISQGYQQTTPGSVFYSNNSGQTWNTGNFIGSEFNRMRRIQMLNDDFGYAVGDYGKFWKTTDSGINFDSIPVPPAGNFQFMNDLEFFNQDVGWVVGGIPGTFQNSFIAKTTNGGASWIDQTPSPNPMRFFIDIDMVDTSLGYFVSSNVGEIYKTTNGGTNWIPMIVPGASSNFINVKAFDANNLYATSYLGSFFKTTDGGANWAEIIPPVRSNGIFNAYWLDKNNGLMVGTLGLIEKTSDGGQTWTVLNAGGWTVYGAYMSHPDTFWVSAGYGQVFKYAAGVVPVELSSFLSSINGNNVMLTWSTATETNNKGFAVERSEDFSTWVNLGFVEGKGTSTQTNNYSFADKNVANGKYYYRIIQTDFDGTYRIYYLGSEIEVGAPANFALLQNYPNPFNPSTRISYQLPVDSKVKIELYGITGEKVATLINADHAAGYYNLELNAGELNLASGLYLYRMTAQDQSSANAEPFVQVKKLLLTK